MQPETGITVLPGGIEAMIAVAFLAVFLTVSAGAILFTYHFKPRARLMKRGILYAPDYVIHAGGIINVALEYLGDSNEAAVRERIERIPDRLEHLEPGDAAALLLAAHAHEPAVEHRAP